MQGTQQVHFPDGHLCPHRCAHQTVSNPQPQCLIHPLVMFWSERRNPRGFDPSRTLLNLSLPSAPPRNPPLPTSGPAGSSCPRCRRFLPSPRPPAAALPPRCALCSCRGSPCVMAAAAAAAVAQHVALDGVHSSVCGVPFLCRQVFDGKRGINDWGRATASGKLGSHHQVLDWELVARGPCSCGGHMDCMSQGFKRYTERTCAGPLALN